MIQKQRTLKLSPYQDLYDKIIPQDHILRKINELIDFSFVYEELLTTYCQDNGRNAIDPVRMFKYLLLKVLDNLSDIDIVERSRYDMSYKYFLDMAPEDPVINASSLTKFRKLRLKDSTLLDLLIGKTVEVALEKGIIKKRSILIVDSTHTKARYTQKSQIEVLRELSKHLRKTAYSVDDSIKDLLPPKSQTNDLEDEIRYCQELLDALSSQEITSEYSAVKEKMNLLKEKIDDDIEYFSMGKDKDARVGHKSADTSFFGYKTHLAMSDERIITAAVVTSGEKNDGKQLQELLKKSKQTGIEIEAVVGDTAYSGSDNIKHTKEENIHLVSKLNPLITQGNRKKGDVFEFNKDAGMYVCKAGHLAIRKKADNSREKGKSKRIRYYFDVSKCQKCPFADGCYKPGAKTKNYYVTIHSEPHSEQALFQKTEYFKEKSKERYKIEAKNSELKNRHGYDVANANGLENMELQGVLSIFAVNLKRIVKLLK